MLKALSIKLYPNKQQQIYLNQIFGCYRKVYNLTLSKAMEVYEDKDNNTHFTTLTDFGNFFHKELLKDEKYSYLKEHNTKILKDSLQNLSKAYQKFFKKEAGFPNFKKRSYEQKISLYKEAFSKKVFSEPHKLFISKHFGKIKFRTSKEYNTYLEKYKNNILRITIGKTKGNTYYARVLVDSSETKQLPKTDKVIGIDMGIKDFIVTSDGKRYDNIRLTKHNEKQVKNLSRQLSKKQRVDTGEMIYSKKWKKDVKVTKLSNNGEKVRLRLARLEEHIGNIKKNYLHEIVIQLLNDNQVIVREDLNVKGMIRNHKLAKSIQDLNIGEFFGMLDYESFWYGREVVKVDRFYASSKICHVCGEKNTSLTLKDREWTCKKCNTLHDRDLNASINLKDEGIRLLGSRTTELTLADNPLMDDKVVIPLKSNDWRKQEQNTIEIIHFY